MKRNTVSFSFVVLLSLTLRQFAHADAPKATAVPCELTPAEFSGLSGDAVTDIHAMDNYKEVISSLLRRHRFGELDCLANSVRASKETFPGGTWKLHTIYTALDKPPLHATQQDWTMHMSLVEQWVATSPHSITARIALAKSYVAYGWYARGDGEGDTVSSSGWRLFKERIAKANQILQQASALHDKCPESYVAMQSVALAQGWTPEATRALFEKAVEFEPAYFYYYVQYANSILPKWGGQEGAAEEFLQTNADRRSGEAGDILYFQIAGKLLCICGGDEKLKLSWPRIQRGFAAVEKRYGASVENWNVEASMATHFNDPLV